MTVERRKKMEDEQQALRLGSVVWGVMDITRAIRFWAQALDHQLKYSTEADWAILVPKDGDGMQLSLNMVTSPHARRHHLDLFAQNQAAEVDRLQSLGATLMDWKYSEGCDYVVMRDPDGNPICVVQE
jgi:predicted enzyme related to lactoylglutathione lyase